MSHTKRQHKMHKSTSYIPDKLQKQEVMRQCLSRHMHYGRRIIPMSVVISNILMPMSVVISIILMPMSVVISIILIINGECTSNASCNHSVSAASWGPSGLIVYVYWFSNECLCGQGPPADWSAAYSASARASSELCFSWTSPIDSTWGLKIPQRDAASAHSSQTSASYLTAKSCAPLSKRSCSLTATGPPIAAKEARTQTKTIRSPCILSPFALPGSCILFWSYANLCSRLSPIRRSAR